MQSPPYPSQLFVECHPSVTNKNASFRLHRNFRRTWLCAMVVFHNSPASEKGRWGVVGSMDDQQMTSLFWIPWVLRKPSLHNTLVTPELGFGYHGFEGFYDCSTSSHLIWMLGLEDDLMSFQAVWIDKSKFLLPEFDFWSLDVTCTKDMYTVYELWVAFLLGLSTFSRFEAIPFFTYFQICSVF